MCTRLCCVCALRFCVVLFCVFCVLFSVLSSVCCIVVYVYCVEVFCILYWYICLQVYYCACVYLVSVLCVCMCVCILCACVRACEVPVEVTQSDTPHSGCLCGYMVRIIKYKKTQPLIKLKSIWFSTFLLCFKIMLLLSEKVSIKWNVLPDKINRLQPKKTSKNGDIFDLIFLKLLNYFKCVKFRFIFVFIFLCNFQERFSYIFEELVIRFDVLFSL